jgi:hypothetical protein
VVTRSTCRSCGGSRPRAASSQLPLGRDGLGETLVEALLATRMPDVMARPFHDWGRHLSSSLLVRARRTPRHARSGVARSARLGRPSPATTHRSVLRQTVRRRWQAKLKAVKAELRQRLHEPIPVVGAYLRSVVGGHVRYYGVPMNGSSIGAFRQAIGRLWWRALRRRSQSHHLSWERMTRYLDRWLPLARVCHPYPLVRFAVVTQGKSRMR